MRRIVVAVTLLLPFARAATAQTPVSPYRFGWGDAASVTAAGVVFLLPTAMGLPHGAPSCAPCDPATLPDVDRWAVRPLSRSAATASTALLAGVGGFAVILSIRDLPLEQARGNAAVLANAVGWTAASTEWLKVLVRRKRPVLYTSTAAAEAGDRDNQQSFPSGHASVAFAVATSYFVMARREHLRHSTRNALLLYAGAAGVGALRVAASKHFPTDVAAGALLGTGIGWLVATIHPTKP